MHRTKRWKNTHEAIKQSVVDYFSSGYKNPCDFNVAAVCDIANVSRTSFYSHFSDVNSLIKETTSEMLGQINGNEGSSTLFNTDKKKLVHALTKIKANQAFFRNLINYIAFKTTIINEDKNQMYAFDEYCKANEICNENQIPLYVSIHFGFFSCLSYWIGTSCTMPEEQIAELMMVYLHIKP